MSRIFIMGRNGSISPTAFQDMGRGLAFNVNSNGGPKSQHQTARIVPIGGRSSAPKPAADLAEVRQ